MQLKRHQSDVQSVCAQLPASLDSWLMSTGYEHNELSSVFHRSRHRLIEREIKRHTLAAFSPSSLAGGSSVGMMWKLKHTQHSRLWRRTVSHIMLQVNIPSFAAIKQQQWVNDLFNPLGACGRRKLELRLW
jgi:hypothetical protein